MPGAGLTNCRTCKKEIARSAKTCPNCGVSTPGLPGSLPKWAAYTIAGICIFAFGTCTVSMLAGNGEASDPAIIKDYCASVAKQDADNGGVRADGKPWDLGDLAIGAAYEYAVDHSEQLDLQKNGRILDATLRAQPQDETISIMCRSAGSPVDSPNGHIQQTVADAIAALRRSIRLTDAR